MNDYFFLNNSNEEVINSDVEDIIITNREGKIIKVTNVSGFIYGLEPESLLGKSVYELEEQGIFSPAITPLVLKNKRKVITVQTTPEGRKVLITGIPLFNEHHEIEYVLSYSYDMTEIETLQEYLDELNEEMKKVKSELNHLREISLNIDDFIAESQLMKDLLQKAKKVANYDTPIFIQGELGVGKLKLAKYIHKHSKRKNGPFIEFNCSSIPDAILENELYGRFSNEKDKIGLLELARNGTLFIEGVHHLSLYAQQILIKALNEYQNEIRIISTTEVSLKNLMDEGNFREDLYYKLSVVPIYVPPLRERIEDLKYVIEHYRKEICEQYEIDKKFSEDLYLALLELDWPGNHYEIKNVIERMIVQSDSEVLVLDDLPYEYRNNIHVDDVKLNGEPLNVILENVEKRILKEVKKNCKTTTEMAEVLGISQPSVVRKLKKYSL